MQMLCFDSSFAVRSWLLAACFLGAVQSFAPMGRHSLAPFSKVPSRVTNLRSGMRHPDVAMGLFDFLQNKNPSPTSAPASAAPVFSDVTVPRSYDEIHAQAIAGVQAGLAAGVRKMEVEFPPIAQVNKLSDGSASSQRMVRRANAEFATKAASQLAGQARTLFLLSADQEALTILSSQNLPGNVQLGPIATAASAGAGDVVLSKEQVLTPATSKQWAEAAAHANRAPIVILNGVFSNGYPSFDMAYYLKPMTFNTAICGYLIRQFPSQWTVFSAKDGSALDMQVNFVSAQGCVRPDLQAISNALT